MTERFAGGPRRGRPYALAAVVAAAGAIALGASGCGGSTGSATAGGGPFPGASQLPAGLAGASAPRMRLHDVASGTQFDSHGLAGTPYAVTFLYTHCPDVCPLIGSEIRQALLRLGPQARRVAVVAVSVDPQGDTPGAVKAWLARHREPSNFHYLVGTQAQLVSVWKSWYTSPQVQGDPHSAHTAAVWLVDRRGRIAAKLDAGVAFDPGALVKGFKTLLSS